MQTIALSVPGENRLFPKRNGVTALFCIPAVSRHAFYPAPGFRDSGLRVGGALYHVGHAGFSWSSFASEENTGYRLFFTYDEVYPQNHVSHAYGLQLRCLQEEGGGRAADFTLEPGGLSVRENLLRLACGAVELWGLNESLSSSPLRPRWPLLFGIIQKVGKKIIQGGLTSPLEIPRQPPPGPGRSRARRRSVAGDRPRRVHLVVGNSYGE